MIGQTLSNRYQILTELGHGGMGVVYRALDPMLNREVAIKLIPPTLLSPETEQRFQREAQLVAQMDHPAIVPIFDFGKHAGSLFFVMPIVHGTNLRWFEREATLTLGEVIDIGIQVAEALDYSHSRSVIHRDIKPENIMVAREDSGKVRVRIMDFGLARGAAESRITKSGTIAGTLAYLSPEQVAATGVDHRSDIYSLGTVLYECLAGEPPFSGELQSILYRIVHEIPQPIRALGADINEDLEGVILTCIAKDPVKRPQRAGEVAESLRRCQTRLHHSDLSKSVVMTKTLMLPRVALSPFIGREKELAELQKRLNVAISGECQFVVVSGEPTFQPNARSRRIAERLTSCLETFFEFSPVTWFTVGNRACGCPGQVFPPFRSIDAFGKPPPVADERSWIRSSGLFFRIRLIQRHLRIRR